MSGSLDGVGRALPADPNAERAILGAILLDNSTYNQAAELLRPDDFSLDWHCRVYRSIGEMIAAGQQVDLVTLVDNLTRRGELERVGGVAFLADLKADSLERPHIEHYCRIVKELADRRQFAKDAEKAQRLACDRTIATTALAEEGSRLSEIANGGSLPPRFSEEALALRFSRTHSEHLRYVAALGRWFWYDRTCWREDKTLAVFDRVRDVCRMASAECSGTERTLALRLSTAATVAAVVRLASADRRHAAIVEQFDADPFLLNTPTGTLDLRTGKLHPHDREQYFTKMTAAGPGGDCPQWRAFLDRVTAGNKDLQLFLQRVIGYCLTGSTREQALFFLYGTGANGKSVFLSVISGLLDEYAKPAPHPRSRRTRMSNTLPNWRDSAARASSPRLKQRMADGGQSRRSSP